MSKNNRLYVIGGHDGTRFLSSCECYDPLSGKWSFITPLSSPRAGVGCVVLDDILYVAGRSRPNIRVYCAFHQLCCFGQLYLTFIIPNFTVCYPVRDAAQQWMTNKELIAPSSQ